MISPSSVSEQGTPGGTQGGGTACRVAGLIPVPVWDPAPAPAQAVPGSATGARECTGCSHSCSQRQHRARARDWHNSTGAASRFSCAFLELMLMSSYREASSALRHNQMILPEKPGWTELRSSGSQQLHPPSLWFGCKVFLYLYLD